MSIFHSIIEKLPDYKSDTYSNKMIMILIGITGSILIFISSRLYGLGISPDSVYYISAARNLADGKGLIDFYGDPWIFWPPLYPVVLAFFTRIFNTDVLEVARLVNVVLFGVIIYLSGILINRHLVSSGLYRLTGILTILLSSEILQNLATMVWSETLFIFFSLIFLVSIEDYINKKKWESLILASLSVAAAIMTRYIGVFIIVTGLFVLILYFKDSLKRKLTSIFIFGFLSALPIALWLLRNLHVANTFTGDRKSMPPSFWYNLNLTLTNIHNWLVYPYANHVLKIIMLFILILLVGCFLIFLIKRYYRMMSSKIMKAGPLFLFFSIYLILILMVKSIIAGDDINWRLLSPAYIPFMILLLFAIEKFILPLQKMFSEFIVKMFLVSIVVLWIIYYPLKNSVLNVHTWITEGTGGYSRIEWRQSPLALYLQQTSLVPGHLVFSNENDIPYIFAHITCQKENLKINAEVNDVSTKDANIDSIIKNINYSYFIWFDAYPKNYIYTKEQISQSKNVWVLADFKDGTVFIVKQ